MRNSYGGMSNWKRQRQKITLRKSVAWHARQQETWQAMLETLAFWACMAVIAGMMLLPVILGGR